MTLKSRLLFGLGVVAVTLIATSLFIAARTRSNLIEQIDERLAVATERASGFDFPNPPGDDDHQLAPFGQAGGGDPVRLSDMYEGTIEADGTLNTRFEPNLPGEEFGKPQIDAVDLGRLDGRSVLVNVPSETEGVQYRALVRGTGDGKAIVAAIDLESVDTTSRTLIYALVLGLVVTCAVLGMVAWSMLRLGIRPIVRMTRTAKVIAEGDLANRVEAGSPNTESGQLANALNTMLSRIEESSQRRAESEERLRRFVADASHELRTPITTIRGYAELYKFGALADSAELDDAMRRTFEESTRMGRLVEDMLNLAKLDEHRPITKTKVDMVQLANDAAADALAVAPDRDLSVDAPSRLEIDGDNDRLRQVMANIVGNALAYTPPDATIRIRVRSLGPKSAQIEVEDNGPGMSAEDAQRVTERFFRADQSRSRAKGGSGLGMAIVDAIVRAHGGSIELESALGAGTTVRVTLPIDG